MTYRELQTKVEFYENQSTSLAKMRRFAKQTTERNGWRLLDVKRLIEEEA